MSRTLIWDGDDYRRNKVSYDALGALRGFVPLSLGAIAILMLVHSFASWPVSVSLLGAAISIRKLAAKYNWNLVVRRKLNDCYYESMRQALVTKYPHGIVYILQNVLETLEFFNITALPWQDKFFTVQYGWPNQTLLQEAVDAANYLAEKWPELAPPEKTTSMATIRTMIKPEVMYLRGHMRVADVNNPEVQYYGASVRLNQIMYFRNLYIYSFTEQDYSEVISSRPQAPLSQSPAYKPISGRMTNPANRPTRVMSLDEYISDNRSLRYLDKEQQIKKYNEYLAAKDLAPYQDSQETDDVW